MDIKKQLTSKVDLRTQVDLKSGLTPPIVEEETPNEQLTDGQEAEAKTKLYKKLDSMTPFKRMAFLKIMQFNVTSEVLDAVNNGKNTTKATWKNVIGKMYAIKDLKIGAIKVGIDFSQVLSKLIPIIGALAGLFLALREAEKEEIAAAEPDLDPNFPDIINSESAKKICAEEKAKNIQKSVIMQLCELKENGFSYNP